MFQFPEFAHSVECDCHRWQPGFPIRPSRAHSLCAAPPGLSQLTTAFIASVYLGIPTYFLSLDQITCSNRNTHDLTSDTIFGLSERLSSLRQIEPQPLGQSFS